MTTATQTVRLVKAQIPEAGAALARAFHDDPLLTYILSDEVKRPSALRWFMTAAAKYGHAYGEVHTTEGRVDGCAIWLPPGDVKVTLPRMIRAGMLAAPFTFGISALGRFLGATDFYEKLHVQAMPEPHWYLMVLGVDTPRQGQGVGGALTQPVLARADAAGLPCYLETNKTRNVPFYEKQGFSVVMEGDIPKGGPRYWTMRRAPKS